MVGSPAHTTVAYHVAGENHIIATQLLSVRKQPQARRGARGDETNEPCQDREGIPLPQGSGGGRRAHVLRRAAARRRRRCGRGRRRGLGPWIGPGSATPWFGSVRFGSVRGSTACEEERGPRRRQYYGFRVAKSLCALPAYSAHQQPLHSTRYLGL
jgi:hypothetical protein